MARAMKDSGIEWIGEIPEAWGVLPAQRGFTEVKRKNTDGAVQNSLQFKSGSIIPKGNFDADSDEYVASTITTYTVVEPGTVMINGLNLNYDFKTQRTGLVKETGVITSAYLALWPDRSLITPEYATYLFKGYETRMALHNMGAGIRLTLGYKEFKKQPVLFPSLEEQQRIADFLDAECVRIDAVIEQTRASIEEYKKLKQSVITQAVTKGIRPGRKMRDSGFLRWGMIPVDWQIARVKSYVDSFTSGLSAITEDENASDSGKYVLRTSSVSSGTFIPTEVKPVLSSAIDRLICPVESGTLIVSRMNTSKMVGACAYVENAVPDTYLPDKLWKIKLKKTVNTKYFWYSLNATPARAWFSELSTGSSDSMQNISMSDFVNNCIPIPLLDEQQAIVAFLDSKCSKIDGLITTKQQFLAELESYKKSLIFEYVTGKKEVV